MPESQRGSIIQTNILDLIHTQLRLTLSDTLHDRHGRQDGAWKDVALNEITALELPFVPAPTTAVSLQWLYLAWHAMSVNPGTPSVHQRQV
jgi:hypothetical protein